MSESDYIKDSVYSEVIDDYKEIRIKAQDNYSDKDVITYLFKSANHYPTAPGSNPTAGKTCYWIRRDPLFNPPNPQLDPPLEAFAECLKHEPKDC